MPTCQDEIKQRLHACRVNGWACFPEKFSLE